MRRETGGRCASAVIFLCLLGACGPSSTGYQGYVEGEFVYVASSQAGRLEAVFVERGDEVEPGALLFRLEATLEAEALDHAARELAAAEARLADLRVGRRPEERAVVRAQLAQSRAMARNAEEQLERTRRLFEAGAVSEAQLDESRAAAESAVARVAELERQLEVAALPGRAQQIAAAEAQVEAARATLAQAEWRLAEKSPRAEEAARVFDVVYREGEWVPAGRPVLRLLPEDHVKIRFFVPEAALSSIRVGQVVKVECDGCAPGLSATVRYVSAEAEYTPPVIYSQETREKLVFMVEAWPSPEVAPSLHPGQPVTVQP